MRDGRTSSRRMRRPQVQSLARRNEAETSRACAWYRERTEKRARSFLFPFVFIEQTAKFFKLFPGAAAAGKRMEHQLAGGALKNALEHVFGELLLGLFGGLTGFIDMGALAFTAGHQAFGGHYLHKL